MQVVKNPPASAGDIRDVGLVFGSGRSPGEGNATHFGILAWKIPWTEEPGGLQFIGLQRIRHDWAHTTPERAGTIWFSVLLPPCRARVGRWKQSSEPLSEFESQLYNLPSSRLWTSVLSLYFDFLICKTDIVVMVLTSNGHCENWVTTCEVLRMLCVCVCVCVWVHAHTCTLSRFSRVWLFVTLWSVAHQAPLSTGGRILEWILEWVAMPSSRGFSLPTDVTWVSCIARGFFTTEPPRKPS